MIGQSCYVLDISVVFFKLSELVMKPHTGVVRKCLKITEYFFLTLFQNWECNGVYHFTSKKVFQLLRRRTLNKVTIDFGVLNLVISVQRMFLGCEKQY